MNTKLNDLLNLTLARRKAQVNRPKPTPRTIMSDVVPPLTRDDFLSQWKEDVKELSKTKEELNKYKKIINTRFSSEWKEALSEVEKNKKG